MRINADQLENYLQQQTRQNTLPTVFLISGNEPLQIMESADKVRQFCKDNGFQERDLLHVDTKYDWSELNGASSSLSLFSEKKLIDLRIETKSLGKAGSIAVRDYLKNPPEDKVLLIQHPKLVGSARQAAWVKSIEKVGVHIPVWELSAPQTMAWINKKMRQHDMRATPEAVRLLTERVEGNLLAASQEIKKLKLTVDKSNENELLIDEAQVLAAVSDSSRFSIFDLSNAVMAGESQRVQHIHHNLKEEGVAIQLVLWTLSDLSRQLYQASHDLDRGMSIGQVTSKLPKPRQKPFQMALQRLQHIEWSQILRKNAEIDRLSKGQGDTANKGMGRVWSEMLDLALTLSGTKVIHKT